MRKQSGVTLMELMVVVVIIGILSVIAYPSYRDQVRKSNRTEGKVALEQTAAALEKCFTRYMSYSNFGNCPAAAQFNSGGHFDTPHGLYRVTAQFDSGMEFALTATPQNGQAGDSCGALGLDHAGRRTAATANCW